MNSCGPGARGWGRLPPLAETRAGGIMRRPRTYASIRVPCGPEVHRLLRRAMERMRREVDDGRNITKGAAMLAALREYVGGGK